LKGQERLESRHQHKRFFKYAAENWAYHIQDAQDAQQSIEDLTLKFLMNNGSASSFPIWPMAILWIASCCFKWYYSEIIAGKGLDTKDRTPLYYAVEKGKTRLAELLLDYSVSLYSKCEMGWTPIFLAIEKGSAAVVQALLARGGILDYRYFLVGISNCTRIALYWIDD
jgi:Ankyrin repeats (3 copies)